MFLRFFWSILGVGMVMTSAPASSLSFFLWGKTPDNGMQIGSPIHHIAWNHSYPVLMWRPNIGITYHSFNVTYFKSCDNDDAVGLSIQRNVYQASNHNNRLSIGYRLGLTYGGWCINKGINTASNPNCQGKQPILPAVELYVDYSYKSWGIEGAVLGPVIALSILKVWGV